MSDYSLCGRHLYSSSQRVRSLAYQYDPSITDCVGTHILVVPSSISHSDASLSTRNMLISERIRSLFLPHSYFLISTLLDRVRPRACRRSCEWCMDTSHAVLGYSRASLMVRSRGVRGWSRCLWICLKSHLLYFCNQKYQKFRGSKNSLMLALLICLQFSSPLRQFRPPNPNLSVFIILHSRCYRVLEIYSLYHSDVSPSVSYHRDSVCRVRAEWYRARKVTRHIPPRYPQDWTRMISHRYLAEHLRNMRGYQRFLHEKVLMESLIRSISYLL